MTDGMGGDDWETMLDTGKLEASLENLKVVTNVKPRTTAPAVPLPDFSVPPPDPRLAFPPPTGPRQFYQPPPDGGVIGGRTVPGDPPFSGPIRILSNDTRNRFQHQQQQPQLKILKRPNPPQAAQPDSQYSKSSLKTLEQREAEYAEARERILGKEPFPAAATGNQPPIKQQTNKNKNQKKPVNGVGTAQTFTPQEQQPKKGVNGSVPTPRGPDGTNGFQR